MNNGAWRFGRLLSLTLLNALLGSALSAQAQGVDELGSYYQEAYDHGRDLVPGSQTAADTSSWAMVSLAGMAAVLREAEAAAGDASPRHVFAQDPGSPVVRFAECFFIEDGAVRPLSEVLIEKGVAFAARGRALRPIFLKYTRAEGAAREARAGIWATPRFAHPYGERYRAIPSMN